MARGLISTALLPSQAGQQATDVANWISLVTVLVEKPQSVCLYSAGAHYSSRLGCGSLSSLHSYKELAYLSGYIQVQLYKMLNAIHTI